MNIVIWIIMILLVIFLIRLLRKWIKRLIFIVLLLGIAFMIYGFISPTGAARLRYNVRTFPNRVSSWLSSQTFLDYDSYKNTKNLISGDDVESDLSSETTEDNDENKSDSEDESDISVQEASKDTDKYTDNKNETSTKKDEGTSKSSDSSKQDSEKSNSLSGIVDTVKFVEVDADINSESEEKAKLSGYSKSELLSIITKYVEKNLDDDRDILVTVEYDDEDNMKKIILKTLSKEPVKIETQNETTSTSSSAKKSTTTSSTTSSSKLSQKDVREAEELFSVLF